MDVVDQVVALARRLGVAVDRAQRLRSTNNLVVWLAPSAVVAKVARDGVGAARELDAGVLLAQRGAPVVGPALDVDPVVHTVDGRAVTFWRHVGEVDRPRTWAVEVEASLGDLHHHLAQAGEQLDVAEEPADVLAVLRALDDPRFAPLLAPADRRVLRQVLLSEREGLRGHDAVLHGAPHLGNVLFDSGTAVFVDLATICRGPVEWDLAHLPHDVARSAAERYDPALLERCRVLVSAVTAAWCWDGLDRDPDMRRHAMHHLELVRRHRTSGGPFTGDDPAAVPGLDDI